MDTQVVPAVDAEFVPEQAEAAPGAVLHEEALQDEAVELEEVPREPRGKKVRPPVRPPWMRNWADLRPSLEDQMHDYLHDLAFQAMHSPNAYGRLLKRVPRGVKKLLREWHRYAFDIEGREARRGHVGILTGLLGSERASAWRQYNDLADKHDWRVRFRLGVSGAAAGGAAFLLHAHLVSGPLGLLLAQPELTIPVGLGLLGWYGKDRDERIFDSPAADEAGGRLVTNEDVLQAFIQAGLCKADRPIEIASPGVHRDGKGWLANIRLPGGVTLKKVLTKTEEIASGLDVLRQQVFLGPWEDEPTERRVELWVAKRDPYKVKPPLTPLAHVGRVDIFQPIPFGLDARERLVNVVLMFSGMLIGAKTRVGKTFAGRLPVAAAVLDPHVKVRGANGKGDNAWAGLKSVADWYVSGVRESAVRALEEMLRNTVVEMNRRNDLIDQTLPHDRVPESKLTPALVMDKSLGMEPIVIVLDEAQRYLLNDTPAWEPEAGDRRKPPTLGKLITSHLIELARVGSSMGIILILITQDPKAEWMPSELRGQPGLRFCLRVRDRQTSECILGTGTAAAGWDASEVLTDQYPGVGILMGYDDSETSMSSGRIVRTHWMDLPAFARICQQGRSLRIKEGTLTGYAAGEVVEESGPQRNVCDDVRAVFALGEQKLHSDVICERLAKAHPEAYDGWEQADLAARLRPFGVLPKDTWGVSREDEVKRNRQGYDLADVMKGLGRTPSLASVSAKKGGGDE